MDDLTSSRTPLEQIAAGFGEIFTGIRRAASDPIITSIFVSLLLIAAGFGAFFIAWKGSAATLAVGVQMAFLVSGGAAGFGLVAAGMGIAYIQMSRHLEAREVYAWSTMLDRAIGLLGALKTAR
jgi:uncharacterized membrane protein